MESIHCEILENLCNTTCNPKLVDIFQLLEEYLKPFSKIYYGISQSEFTIYHPNFKITIRCISEEPFEFVLDYNNKELFSTTDINKVIEFLEYTLLPDYEMGFISD